ncbi:MAG: DUF4870 domain-containing protein [Actinobacteria bacterium]|nr:DUF4870 domain-containing protein [Actinomycetota bacterium]
MTTNQSPEFPDTSSTDEVTSVEAVEAEIVETEPETVEPGGEPEPLEAEVVGLDLGDEAPDAPTGTDFDVVTSTEPAAAAPTNDFGLADRPAAESPATPAVEPPAASAAPIASPPAPAAPVTPPPPAGGSFLDLPPLPDLDFPAPTPPASPYPPVPPSYPQAADYQRPEYNRYPGGYGEQVAGQAYGHGAAPVGSPQPTPYPPTPDPYASPYGTPTGFAVQPYDAAPGGDRSMASAAHWGALVAGIATGGGLGFLVPLILLVTKGQSDPLVRANAVESLNFNITVLIGMIASVLLTVAAIGIVGLIVIPIAAVILQVLGAMAANRGEAYRYPISIRFVK